ncbi:MAG: DUF1192 family protein [Rhizobiales bacterium]|nr:DUF1192 family protein [Hyphomicrobiales bacterium]
MNDQDDLPRAKSTHPTIGEDLTTYSRAELAERIRVLEAEIERHRAEIARKTGQRDAADSLFRD